MSTLTTLQKAPVLHENGTQLGEAYNVASSDTTVLTAAKAVGQLWYAHGQAAGTATLTATRISDGGEATLEVTVNPAPFSIALGAPEPK